MASQNNKKVLAEQLKNKLNSPEYIAVPDLISYEDGIGDIGAWPWIDMILVRENINNGEKDIVYRSELEKDDWEKTVNLSEKRNKEKRQNYENRKREIETKLNSQPNLYYYYNKSKRAALSGFFDYPDKKGKYLRLFGKENGRTFWLNINANHPVLNNFPWEKNGYYLIETNKPIERNDRFGRPWGNRGEENKNNFHKWVEVDDQITITPYQVENDNDKELPEPKGKGVCDICTKEITDTNFFFSVSRYHGKKGPRLLEILDVCETCYKAKEQEYLNNYEVIFKGTKKEFIWIKKDALDCYAGKKDQNGETLKQENCSHCQPWKQNENKPKPNKLEKEIINFLIKYFQANQIKEIKLKNSELVIVNNNNNEVIKSEIEIKNDPELSSIQNLLLQNHKSSLNQQDLNISSSLTLSQNSQKLDYTPYVIGSVVGIGVILLVVVSYCWGKKQSKKD